MSSTTIVSEVPVGSIQAISSNLTGSYPIPASGVVDALGWFRMDGTAIPAGNTLSGTPANMEDNRFLMGISTTTGATGGANASDISHVHTTPSHTHVVPAHSHGAGTYSAMIGETGAGKILKADGLFFVGDEISTTGALGGPTSSTANSTGAQVNGESETEAAVATAGATPTTDSGGDINHENRPLFFTVQYIIKVS